MRIRRNTSKLLGSTSVYAKPWPPPPPPAAEPTGIVCELNCSPWDVMLINALPNSSCSLTNPKGEEEDGGILGNLIKTEVEEPIYSAIPTSIAAELNAKKATTMQSDEKKKVKKIVERKKSVKGKEKVAAAEMSITYCKKNDGKGWHCKRPAQLPHTFCSYHLAQTRSYSSNHRAIDHASEAAAADINVKNQETSSSGGDSNNFYNYYYYYGFEPWRGKRRGRAATVNAEVEEEDVSRKSMNCDDDDNNVIAGDDEYSLDCFDEDDGDNDDCYSMPHQVYPHEKNGKKKEVELGGKRVVKKRGRKPLKSRSLKSLL